MNENNLVSRILMIIGLSLPFEFISCPTPARRTTPEDRERKQEATAAQKRQTSETQTVRCRREKRLQEGERLSGKQFRTDLELQEREPLREAPKMATRTARQQSALLPRSWAIRNSLRGNSHRDTSKRWP